MRVSLIINALVALPSSVHASNQYDLFPRNLRHRERGHKDCGTELYLPKSLDAFKEELALILSHYRKQSLQARTVPAAYDRLNAHITVINPELGDETFHGLLLPRGKPIDVQLWPDLEVLLEKLKDPAVGVDNVNTFYHRCETQFTIMSERIGKRAPTLQQASNMVGWALQVKMGRRAAAKRYSDNDKGHQFQIKRWAAEARKWTDTFRKLGGNPDDLPKEPKPQPRPQQQPKQQPQQRPEQLPEQHPEQHLEQQLEQQQPQEPQQQHPPQQAPNLPPREHHH